MSKRSSAGSEIDSDVEMSNKKRPKIDLTGDSDDESDSCGIGSSKGNSIDLTVDSDDDLDDVSIEDAYVEIIELKDEADEDVIITDVANYARDDDEESISRAIAASLEAETVKSPKACGMSRSRSSNTETGSSDSNVEVADLLDLTTDNDKIMNALSNAFAVQEPTKSRGSDIDEASDTEDWEDEPLISRQARREDIHDEDFGSDDEPLMSKAKKKAKIKKKNPNLWLDRLRKLNHAMLEKKLDDFLSSILNEKDLGIARVIIKVMVEKYKKATQPQRPKVNNKVPHPISLESYRERIVGDGNDHGAEEKNHPWLPENGAPKLILRGPLMRAWDQFSQAQCRDPLVGFTSGGAGGMLNTFKRRCTSIEQHADWGNRNKTYYISWSSSIKEIAKERVPRFQKRQEKCGIRDNTKLTLMNPNWRLAAGLPLLDMKKEMEYYEVENKYGESPLDDPESFYHNEWLAPFSVVPAEIVGTWTWRVIEKWIARNGRGFEKWYDQVAIPAFNEHERVRQGGKPNSKKVHIGCDCCGASAKEEGDEAKTLVAA